MVELIGDVCVPSELIVPAKTGTIAGDAGNLFLSGGKLWFNPTKAGTAELVTSS